MKKIIMKNSNKKQYFNKIVLLILTLSTYFMTKLYAQNTYYVATNGNDSNNGSFGSPWKNINTSLGKIFPGDTLEIMAGAMPVACGFQDSGIVLASIRLPLEFVALRFKLVPFPR